MKRNECTDPFLRGYLDAALFTTDENPPGGQDYVECGRSAEMFESIPADFLEQAKRDCATFEAENGELLERAGSFEQNGHDLWFSRNGHGAGYFDRGYPDEIADPLQEAARKYGEVYLELEQAEANDE